MHFSQLAVFYDKPPVRLMQSPQSFYQKQAPAIIKRTRYNLVPTEAPTTKPADGMINTFKAEIEIK